MLFLFLQVNVDNLFYKIKYMVFIEGKGFLMPLQYLGTSILYHHSINKIWKV